MSYRNDPGAPAAPEGVYAFGPTEWEDIRHLSSLAGRTGSWHEDPARYRGAFGAFVAAPTEMEE